MGFDNGIMIKRSELTDTIPWIKKLENNEDKNGQYDFEVCYWRKCQNIRSLILFDALAAFFDSAHEIILSLDDLYAIRAELRGLNKRAWGDDQPQTWEEHKCTNKLHIKRLNKLIKLKKKYRDKIEIYFYDNFKGEDV